MDLHNICNNAKASDASDDEMDEVEWMEDENTEILVIECLFCNCTFTCFEDALSHCGNLHKFDFNLLKKKFNMDCYSFIKLINFIRSTNTSPGDIISLKLPSWNDDIYLKPVKEFDSWLMFDFEEYFNYEIDETSVVNDYLKPTSSSYEQQITLLQSQLQQKDQVIEELNQQLSQMKTVVHKILLDEGADLNEDCEKRVISQDNPYFESYSHPAIHYDMLSDEIRTLGYKIAIQNAQLSHKKVLDLGCGTGILSMFAAKQGAERVYAVDNSDIIYYTMDIVRENKLEDRIEVIKARIEDEPLPITEVDVIISEWMGYFLLFEGMLDSLIFARDRYLKPSGIMLPSSCSLFLCGANDPDGHKSHAEFWSNVYGFQMSCIKNEVIKEAVIDIMTAERIVTTIDNIFSCDLYKCTVADTDFTSSFELTCNDDTTVTTFVSYFDTIFQQENSSNFSTSPYAPPTHWKQTLFHLSNPISCKKGETLKGNISCRRGSRSKRSLSITITVDKRNFLFDLSQ